MWGYFAYRPQSRRNARVLADGVSANDIGDSMAYEAASLLLPHLLPQRAPEGRRRTTRTTKIQGKSRSAKPRARDFSHGPGRYFSARTRAWWHHPRRPAGGAFACSWEVVFTKRQALPHLLG